MELYIGGRYQGKAAYVLNEKSLSSDCLTEAEHVLKKSCMEKASARPKESVPVKPLVLNHLEKLIKGWLREGKEPVEEIKKIVSARPDIILICDEVGNGIVPVDKEERRYREEVGRTLCFLAERAERVERIFCGIGRRIK